MSRSVEDALRLELKITSDQLRKSEFNLEAQRVEVKQLNNMYFKLKDEYNVLLTQKNDIEVNLTAANNNNNRLLRRINRLREMLVAAQNAGDFEPIIYNKVWHDLRSTLSKRKRKKIYRSILDRGIRQILECSRARVFLTLGNEIIAFQWSEQELRCNSNAGYIFPQNIVPLKRNGAGGGGGTYALECERPDDEYRITHTKEEIRKVIYIMDSHTVSCPAYHELHILSDGVLPPLNQIKSQKKEMTEKLNFYVVPGVSNNENCIIK